MTIRCSMANNLHRDKPAISFFLIDPFARQREHDQQMRLKYRSENDPERPPEREPGDKYILIGAVVGLITGGTAGAIVGVLYSGVTGIFLGVTIGSITGGIIGVIIGDSIKKRRQRKNRTKDHSGSPDYR